MEPKNTITIYYKLANNLMNQAKNLCEMYEFPYKAKKLGVDCSPSECPIEAPFPACYVGDNYIGNITQLAKYLDEWDRVHGDKE